MGRITHALIMAAGRGARMMPLTSTIAKPLAPYRDSTLIAAGIAMIRPHIEHLHVTVGYRGAAVAHHLIEQGVSTILNTEGRPNSWWLYHTVLRHLDEPLFVLTCDNVTDVDFALLERDYVALGEPAGMVVPVKPVPGLEGDYIFHDEGVVTDLSRIRESAVYCSGIQVLHPAKVNAITRDEGDFYAVWRQLIARRQLYMSRTYPKNWFTVDTVADLETLHGRHPIGAR